VRLLIATDRLPYAPASSEEADIAFANLLRSGRPDVLVLGTSSIRNALRPDTLEALVAEETGQAIHVQGVAQGGLSLPDQELIVAALAERELLPEVVILGLTPSTITGKGFRNLWFSNSELGRAWSGCDGLEGHEAAECLIGTQSALWRWRGQLERIGEALAGPLPRTLETDGRMLQESGWTSEDGVNARRLERMIKGTVRKLPEGLPQADDMTPAYASLIEALVARGTTVIPVAIPYAPPLMEALVERNPDWLDELDAGYANLASASGVDIVQVDAFGDWWRPKSSNDLRHLSAEGAEQVTRQLYGMDEFREPLLEGLGSAA
jgi:hypothetical protein